MELERKYCGDKLINNTLQTNGTLVDSRWADFFAENRFLVGISIDGPQNVHDRFRRSKSGDPSFRRVMDGMLALRRAGVEFNTLTAVSKASEGHGAEIYSFLKAAGSHYIQFLPVVEKVVYPRTAKSKPDYSARPSMTAPESDGDGIATWSVDSIAYGKFLCEVFDIWVKYDVGNISSACSIPHWQDGAAYPRDLALLQRLAETISQSNTTEMSMYVTITFIGAIVSEMYTTRLYATWQRHLRPCNSALTKEILFRGSAAGANF